MSLRSKTALSLDALAARLAVHFDDVADLTTIAEGEESQAFAFWGDGTPLIARINATAPGFEKDRLAEDRFSTIELPIPEVLLIDTLDGAALCVSRCLPGQTLQSLKAGAAYSYGAAVAGVLDAIAASDISMLAGYGPFDANGQAAFTAWENFVVSIDDRERYDWESYFDDEAMATIQPLLAMVRRMAPDCPTRPALVHGDFGSNNVLCAHGAITGVIDWSEAMVGDPLYDIANIMFWRSWLDCMEQQARFFEREQPGRLADGSRLTCYQLRIGLAILFDAAAAQDQRLLNWAMERCGEIANGI